MAKPRLPEPPQVPLELWRELYQAAAQFQSLAPWEWMGDRQVLGVTNEHGVRLLSVLGGMGEVFGLATYLGTTGANFLLRLLREEIEPESPDALFQQDALLLDLVPRQELRKEDGPILKAVGFKLVPSQPRRFPQFYSHKPGYVPWFIDEAEARCLLDGLRKVLPFAALVRAEPDAFGRHRPNEYPFFPNSFAEPLTWDSFVWHVVTPTPVPLDPVIAPAPQDLAALLNKPPRPQAVWELGSFFTRMPISQPPRPYWPKMGLAVDEPSGYVLQHELGGPNDTMAQTAAGCLAQAIGAHGFRPATIKVDSINLRQALAALADALAIQLIEVRSLPMLNSVRQALEAHNRA